MTTKLSRYLLPNIGAILVLILVLTGRLGAAGSSTIMGQSATTTTISYQGRLTDVNGKPLTATLPMVFGLYTAPTGGTAVWSESRTAANAVPVTSGLFNVLLGSVTPINISLLNRDLWLGIAVNGDPEMAPREKLASVPYAARAGLAQTVPDRSITGAKLANGSVSSSKLSLGNDTVCRSLNVEFSLPGNWQTVDVPGLALTFALDTPQQVLIWADGLAHIRQSLPQEVDIHLDLDNVTESASFSEATDNWFGIKSQRLVNVGAGTHTLAIRAGSQGAGDLLVHGIGGYRTCINYMVMGQ